MIKLAGARELIGLLPSPSNTQRNLALVPDIQIAFALSTSPRLPRYVAERIAQSHDSKSFKDTSLLGLCSSGRGMPVEIFLHDHFMMAIDPSGEIFEEVTWHETVHGIEGIELDQSGKYIRKTPWSYELQQEMLRIDASIGHIPALPNNPDFAAYVNYLRRGTSLQQNVSEVFARVAVMFMYEIKENKTAPVIPSGFAQMMKRIKNSGLTSQQASNLDDFAMAYETFSQASKSILIKNMQEMLNRIAQLYGCEIA